MQGALVQSLVWEDNTCRGATKTVRHSHGACVLHLLKRLLQPERPEATETRSPRPQRESSPQLLQPEKARAHQQRPSAANQNFLFNLKKNWCVGNEH